MYAGPRPCSVSRTWRHLCHAIRLNRDEATTVLASGEIILLAIPVDPRRRRRFPASYWLVVKRATKLRPKEHQFVVVSASEGAGMIEAYGLEIARCPRVEGYYHLLAGEEHNRVVARLREQREEEGA